MSERGAQCEPHCHAKAAHGGSSRHRHAARGDDGSGVLLCMAGFWCADDIKRQAPNARAQKRSGMRARTDNSSRAQQRKAAAESSSAAQRSAQAFFFSAAHLGLVGELGDLHLGARQVLLDLLAKGPQHIHLVQGWGVFLFSRRGVRASDLCCVAVSLDCCLRVYAKEQGVAVTELITRNSREQAYDRSLGGRLICVCLPGGLRRVITSCITAAARALN